MIFYTLFLCLFVMRVTVSEWADDWMNPIHDQIVDLKRSPGLMDEKPFNDEVVRLLQERKPAPAFQELTKDTFRAQGNELTTASLKAKLEETLQNAKLLAESLRVHILELVARESLLKDTIVNGRLGVTTVTVSTLSQEPRSYIIREGRWVLCNGMLQFPMRVQSSKTNLFNELFNEPRCIGREVPTIQDPCVFNSVIKYEVVPSRRSIEYVEEDYLCLKSTFNNTLERYMSVTKQTVNDTCREGVIRSLAENDIECGIRILSEYSFYPFKSSGASALPLEYCVENDGSCKLITAWHVSNTTIENFDFLKNEQSFKSFFLKAGSYLGQVI